MALRLFKATLAEGTDKWLISQEGGPVADPVNDNGTEDNQIDPPIEKEGEPVEQVFPSFCVFLSRQALCELLAKGFFIANLDRVRNV